MILNKEFGVQAVGRAKENNLKTSLLALENLGDHLQNVLTQMINELIIKIFCRLNNHKLQSKFVIVIYLLPFLLKLILF